MKSAKSANAVTLTRIERGAPVHISAVIAELLPRLEYRPESAATTMDRFSSDLSRERNGRTEKVRQLCLF